MNDQLPGLQVHINEGRLAGTFELPPADMQQIRYQGRVVLVLVADVMRIAIGETKDGDTKASWTMKAVDAAIVRDEGMKDHLANTLYLDGVAPELPEVPTLERPKQIGMYDEEGAFLGFQPAEEKQEIEVLEIRVPEPETFVPEEGEPIIRHNDPILEKFLNERVSDGVR